MIIPQVFHRIWLGGHAMPAAFEKWGRSWPDLNPGWELRTWTERELETRFPDDDGLISRCCHLSQRSNVYRYKVIEAYGGVYVDTDYECWRPVGPLLEGIEAWAAYKLRKRHVMSGIFGATAHHPWAADLVQALTSRDPAVSLSMGSALVQDVTDAHPEVHRFAAAVFCPLGTVDVRRALAQQGGGVPEVDRRRFPQSYACHYWSSNWSPSGFVRL